MNAPAFPGAGRILAHDADWQYPAVTEKHAFARMAQSAFLIPKGCVYLGFPWATLIDSIDNRADAARPLLKALDALASKAKGARRVVTVCQHIRMLNHQDAFWRSGVTDVFWSHAVKGQKSFPDRPSIRIRPFPLFPVQQPEATSSGAQRRFLFSFVGARAKPFYLTQARNRILDLLGDDPRGFVLGRDDWHYNRIVYQHQLLKRTGVNDRLVDEAASDEFRKTLSQSIFSLCPSGSGPNSIRLWESIGAGAAPVILSDRYEPPGPAALWEEAAVFCPETDEAIRALPDRLEAMARDEASMASRRRAMAQLWALYGPESFVYDIEKLFLADTVDAAASGLLPLSGAELAALAREAEARNDPALAELLLTACASRLLLETPGFEWPGDEGLMDACDKAAQRTPNSPAVRSYKAVARTALARRQSIAFPSARPVRIFRMGSNAGRMPFAYPAYRPHFAGLVEEVARPEDAEAIIFGASPNMAEHADEIAGLARARPDLRFVVLSEEPLWETTWSRDHDRPRGVIGGAKGAEYALLAHTTSDIFAFDRIPYFITTSDDFFLRYARLFQRNASLGVEDVISQWRSARWRAAFIAERRTGAVYDVRDPANDLQGLCAWRTHLAEAARGGDILRVGKGWPDGAPRQTLADWHLDKIVMLDRNAFIISGIENTHHPEYVTEKLFDAYALLGAPLYCAGPRHKARRLVPDGSYLNLYGMSATDAASVVAAFEPDTAFVERYLEAQRGFAEIFSDPDILVGARSGFARRVAFALGALCGRNEERPAP